MELYTGQSPRAGCQQQQLQATTQDGLFQPLLNTHGAVEMLHVSALYKCTIDIGVVSSYMMVCSLCVYVLVSSQFLAKKFIFVTLYNVCYLHFILAV